MISVVLCKVSQPSLQKRKSYDENFVTAKSARINYGATLTVGLIKLLLSQNIRFRVKVAIINQLFYADVLSQMA